MDAIEPILPNPSILPEVRAAQRTGPVHRDGHQDDGPPGRERRRRAPDEGVEVDVEGVEETEADADGSVTLLELPAPHRIDVTADDADEPSTRRIDLSA